MNAVGAIFLVVALLLIVALFFFWRLAWRLIKRLPQIESFFPQFHPLKVRGVAFVFGLVLWMTLFGQVSSGPGWHTLRLKPISVATASGAEVPPIVYRSNGREAASDFRELIRGSRPQPVDFDGEDFVASAREIGFMRLGDITGRRTQTVGDHKVFVQSSGGLAPALRVTEQMTSIAQPVSRGWLSRRLNPEGEPVFLTATLWCGYDVSTETSERFCVIGLPIPMFVKLFPEQGAGSYQGGITLSAPTVFLRLDAAGAEVTDVHLTHARFDDEGKGQDGVTLADLGLVASVQGKRQGIVWRDLLGGEIEITITENPPPKIVAHQWLWSRRAVTGEDNWLFASREGGMPNLERVIDAPKLLPIAHDFLAVSDTPLVSEDLRNWLDGLLLASAVGKFDDETPAVCRKVASEFARSISLMNSFVRIQLPRTKNSQAVFLDDAQCPGEVLPVLLALE